jgi:PTS system galactitol-specific IIB component
LKKNILLVCGTGIATSTVVGEKIKEIAKENGFDVNINQVKVTEAKSHIEDNQVDLLIATTQLPFKVEVPYVKGLPFISGVGEEETIENVIKILKD